MLWAYNPPIKALVALVGTRRLHLYSTKIRSLTFDSGEECLAHRPFTLSAAKVTWPKLAELVIDASDDNREQYLVQYLQPGLLKFELFGGPVSDTFLAAILVSYHIHSWHWSY